MLKYQFFIAAALLAGVAIGYFVKPSDSCPPSEAVSRSVAKKAVADMGNASSITALRKRIAELEKLLAEKDGKSEVAISNAVAEAVKNVPSGRPHGNWRERMEELKKTDPARYVQRTNWFAQVRRSREERARNTIDFLSSIDTSHMSAGAKKTHGALQELIARREELEERIHQEGISDEERGKLFGELHQTNHELFRLNNEERKNLIAETARNLGFEGEDAQEISATIQEVIQATDPWGGGHRHGPPPGGPGPGGPGGR